MKKKILTLVHSEHLASFGFLFLILVSATVHLLAFFFSHYKLLVVFYPILFVVLIVISLLKKK